MKNRKKMSLFLVLTIIVQTILYILLDWQAGHLLNPSFQIGKTYNLPISMEHTHAHQLSYNNHYLAYLSDNADNQEVKGNSILNVIDLTKNQHSFVSQHKITAHVLGYQWLPDRNSLVYLVKGDTQDPSKIQLYTLDLDIVASQTIEAKYNRDLPYPADILMDIGISTYTNNLFFLLANDKGKAILSTPQRQLIKMDIMKTIHRLNLQGEEIQRIAVSNKFGTAYLVSTKNSEKFISSSLGMERTIISNDPDHILLGCYNEKLYTGKLVENQLIEIWQSIDGSTYSIWKGSIPFSDLTETVSLDDKVIVQNPEHIDLISQSGHHKRMLSTSDFINIVSPTAKMVMEIKTSANSTRYTWRALNL